MLQLLRLTAYIALLCQVTVVPVSSQISSCPAGFAFLNNVCVQQVNTCPVNYVLQNGVCVPQSMQPCTSGACSLPAPAPTPCQAPCPVIPTTPCSAPCQATSQPPCTSTNVCSQTTIQASCTSQPPQYPCPQSPCAQNPCPQSPCPQSPCPQSPCPQNPCPQNPSPQTPCPQNPYPQSPCAQSPYPQSPCPQNPYPQTPCPQYPSPKPPLTPPTLPPPVVTPPPTERTTEVPPAELTKCPPGTILIDYVCRAIYCKYGLYSADRCIEVQCPSGTIWNGSSCKPIASLEPNSVSTFTWNTTIVAPSSPDNAIVLNNYNNFNINASITLPANPIVTESESELESELEPEPEPEAPTTVKPKPESNNCCTVMGPRTCRTDTSNGRWKCASNRYKQCGDICLARTVMLKPPPVPQRHQNIVVMPPDVDFGDCSRTRSCDFPQDYYDCSGCELRQSTACSKYCYNYRCSSRSCAFYDQRSYCQDYPGQGGCRSHDGCFDDWCGDNY